MYWFLNLFIEPTLNLYKKLLPVSDCQKFRIANASFLFAQKSLTTGQYFRYKILEVFRRTQSGYYFPKSRLFCFQLCIYLKKPMKLMKKNPIYARKLESVKNHNFVYKETERFTESCIANFLTIDYFSFSSSYL